MRKAGGGRPPGEPVGNCVEINQCVVPSNAAASPHPPRRRTRRRVEPPSAIAAVKFCTRWATRTCSAPPSASVACPGSRAAAPRNGCELGPPREEALEEAAAKPAPPPQRQQPADDGRWRVCCRGSTATRRARCRTPSRPRRCASGSRRATSMMIALTPGVERRLPFTKTARRRTRRATLAVHEAQGPLGAAAAQPAPAPPPRPWACSAGPV